MKVLCSVCPLLLEKNSLKAHMRLHREVNSYSCEVCKKNFKVKSYLIEHMKTHKFSFDCNLLPHDCKFRKQTLLYKIKLKIYWLFKGIAPNFYLLSL